MDISIIIPFYNEEESLSILHGKIQEVLNGMGKLFEIIFVDDGSIDNSNRVIRELQLNDDRIKFIEFTSNNGKANALNAGFLASTGSVVFTMDADLQDDPREIPVFLSKIEEGFDMVIGWKKKRFDPLEKRIPSKLFNFITSLVTGITLHDFNCGFKAYKRDIIEEVKVYGDLHRYIPALAHSKGYRIGEIPVQHHPREFGESKYGWKRYFSGFFDIFTVVLLTRFITKPIYLFGLTGFSLLIFGLTILMFITCLQIIYGSILGHKPLSYLGVLSFLLGSQMVATGLIAEMLVSLKAQGEKKFSVREILFFGEEAAEYDISIVIPMRNESNRIKPFLQDLNEELLILQKTCEVIFIDNGSDDDTFDNLKAYAFSDMVHLKIIRLRKAYALSSAIQAGFQFVNGNYIITMTAGQRNIVTSISRLTDCLQDNQIARGYRIGFPSFIGSILSVVFNKTISFLSGVQVNDLNCNMYAFRKEILETIRSYGDRQRFYPLVAAKQGCRLVEVPMNYEDFRPGSLKKKFKRIPADILDILTVILLTDFKARPLHLFGLIGIVCGLIGLSINLYLTILKFWTGTTGGHYTLLLMGVTLMILGLQWFTTGLLGEVINSVYQKAKLP